MQKDPTVIPLAERCRPATVEQFIGQRHLLGDGRILKTMLGKNTVYSMIFWGEPGSGKTTLARLIAEHCSMDSHFLSAISAGVADVRKVIEKGRENRKNGVRTLLFLDEIHRFNKAQQDSVLGSVEAGDIVLIGATTENPSFSIISPLLSRTRVIKLERFSAQELETILRHALESDEILKGMNIRFDEGVQEKLIGISNGDARRMLNILETAALVSRQGLIDQGCIDEAVKNSFLYYDRAGDHHYDTISAFIKSMRGSDPDAAVYYMARMLHSGEDPEFITRRMVIFASEDVGNAVPQAITMAVSTLTAVRLIGMPEAEIVLSQCATFLASAPKSNASYMALRRAQEAVRKGEFTIPMHIRNAPTGMMERFGYGKGYRYPHDYPEHFIEEDYLPEELKGSLFYEPTELGSEKTIRERLKRLWPRRFRSG
ncbi:MAG: replication-associated recombination protein A [Spirochaetes bacterium]|nr:replication-associated recombination protein A [Spirochaetota bacterium]